MAHIARRHTASGLRYEVRYRIADGRERSKSFRTRKEAERFEAQTRVDLASGRWIDPRGAAKTFSNVAKEWLASNPAKRSSSYARDESVIRVHLEPALGARSLGSVTPVEVRALVAEWSQARAARTTKRLYGVLRAIFAYAVDCEYLAISPCRGVKLPSAEPIQAHVVTADDLGRLADAVSEEWAPVVYLGAVLGLRWAECAGLRVGRLDLLERRLTVAEQIVRGYKGSISFGPPKSDAGRRTLTLPEPMVAMLAAHLKRLGLTAADADALVFADRDGGPLRYENWRRRVWLPATQDAGLPGLRFHDLRRANATAMVLDNVDLKTAQTRLGHSDPRLTLAVYAQASTAAERDAADRLGERFFDRPRDIRGMESA